MPVMTACVPCLEKAARCVRGDTSECTVRGRAGRPFAGNCSSSHFPVGLACVED